MIKNLTQKILKQLIHYNPRTGIFTWKVRDSKWFKKDRDWRAWNTRYSGKKSGWIYNHGRTSYLKIRIIYKNYRAHRLAWFYMKGKWPKNKIDHRDGNGINNKFKNLLDVTIQENLKNQKMYSNNTFGVTGIDYKKCQNKPFMVRFMINGNRKAKSFYTKKEAVLFRIKYEKNNGFTKRHGKKNNE